MMHNGDYGFMGMQAWWFFIVVLVFAILIYFFRSVRKR
jgi:preprotein translocase subunit SecF